MTVCVGIVCGNGVALAGDTQVTYVGSHKDYAPKLDFCGNGKFCVALAGSGSLEILNAIFLFIREGLSKRIPGSCQKARDKIKTIVSNVVRQHPQNTENQYLLAAIAVPPEPVKLVQFYRDVLSEPEISVIGCGNSDLSKYFQSSWIKRAPENVKEGLHWASYIVYTAKQFVDGCDGDTDALLVTNDGKIDVIQRSQTKHYEKHFSDLEGGLSELFGMMAIGRLNEMEVKMYLGTLAQKFKRIYDENNK